MSLNYKSLDKTTRSKMIGECENDINQNKLYLSKRFTSEGEKIYREIVISHFREGNDDTLSNDLNLKKAFKTQEERKTSKGVTMVKVPDTASQTFSEGEFNRFYIRGLCLRAASENRQLRVYRARHSENPRPESEALVGSIIPHEKLLEDLRQNIGLDTALGLPSGPNSGLSIELI